MILLDRLTGLRNHLVKNFNIAHFWKYHETYDGEPCMMLVRDRETDSSLSNEEVGKALNHGRNPAAVLEILIAGGPEGLLVALDNAIAIAQEFEVKSDPEEGPEEDPTPTEEEPTGELVAV